jgi:hypothetical protein
MTLRLTDEEIDLIRDALVAYTKILNEQARPHCAGYSTEGIALCCRRMNVETLAVELAHRRSALPVTPDAMALQAGIAHSDDLERVF